MSTKFYLIVMLALITLFTACRHRGLQTELISGTVLLDGQPLDAAVVTFTPLGDGNMGFAITDAQGHYVISTLGAPSGAGTTIGHYAVSMDKTVPAGRQPTPEEKLSPDFDSSKYDVEKTKQLVPKKYLEPKTSGFEVIVMKGSNVFDFNLVSK